MKVLFAPSEGKIKGGKEKFDKNTLFFNSFSRDEILDRYQNFLKTASKSELSKLFGLKKDDEIFQNASVDIFNEPASKAVLKYDGVAYEHLSYNTLSKKAKNFIDNNLIIFSNLFGPLLAKDIIPYYRLSQGAKIDDFDIAKFYKQNFSDELDKFLEDEFIIDLRAKHYEKFYTIKKEFITCKFLKNGKVVSHWAKAYRGLILKELAYHQPQSEEEFKEINFKNLTIKEIIQKKNQKEYVYEINLS